MSRGDRPLKVTTVDKRADFLAIFTMAVAAGAKDMKEAHAFCFTRRCDTNVMAAMMVARSFGMWICARHPEMTTAQVRSNLNLHPAKLVRIMMSRISQ